MVSCAAPQIRFSLCCCGRLGSCELSPAVIAAVPRVILSSYTRCDKSVRVIETLSVMCDVTIRIEHSAVLKCARFEFARSLSGFQALRAENKSCAPGCCGICAYCQLWNNAKQSCVARVILSYEGPALTVFVLRSRGGDSIQCTRLTEAYGYDVHIVVECLFGIVHSFRENC